MTTRRTRSGVLPLALITAGLVAWAGAVRGQGTEGLSNSGGGQWGVRKAITFLQKCR